MAPPVRVPPSLLTALICAAIALLAPACASFDQFQNYEHRGRVFKELVRHLEKGEEFRSNAGPVNAGKPNA